jgi:hypothetical protein
MTAPWWTAFGPAEATLRCGDQQHRLRWEAGRLTAVDHPEAEGELVLGTLGGDQPDCIRLLRAWGERCDDLDVLMLGPRSATDTLTVDSRDAERLRMALPGWTGYPPVPGLAPGGVIPGMPLTWGSLWSRTLRSFAVNARSLSRGTATYGPGPAAGAARVARFHTTHAGAFLSHGPGRARAFVPGMSQDLDRELARRAELLELLALGPAFQFRLCATVADAWSDRDPRTARPALTAALAGRLAPAVAAWLHVSPDEVQVSLAEGPGGLFWDGDRWRAGVRWVAAVWGAGLAVIDGRLVTDVTHAEFPSADVLALEAPAGEPAALAVQCESATRSSQRPRWRLIRP